MKCQNRERGRGTINIPAFFCSPFFLSFLFFSCFKAERKVKVKVKDFEFSLSKY